MRKVILQQWVSIDNFASRPNGDIDFIKPSDDLTEDALKFIDTIDTMLLGSVTYRMFADYWPAATVKDDAIADKLNSIPNKIVFSRALKSAPWGKWGDANVVSEDAVPEVRKIKQEPGKDIVIWGSISLSHYLIKEGLVDEYQLRIVPVFIGEGRGLVPPEIGTANMRLLENKTYKSGIAFMRYQPTQ